MVKALRNRLTRLYPGSPSSYFLRWQYCTVNPRRGLGHGVSTSGYHVAAQHPSCFPRASSLSSPLAEVRIQRSLFRAKELLIPSHPLLRLVYEFIVVLCR